MDNEFYQFSKDDVYRFGSSIGLKARANGSEYVFKYCPYCYGGQNRDKETFSINLDSGQFECKRSSCSVKGNMITLARDFSQFELSKEVSSYYNINGKKDRFVKYKESHRKIEVRPNAIKYLAGRKIPAWIVEKYEVTTDPNNENVLCFPFRDETGEITFFKYRNIDPEHTGSKEWCAKGNTKKILFGMHQCEDFGTLVITEGQIDSLSVAACGVKNAVSVPTGKNGFTWRPNVWEWLVKFNEIVVFGDNENGEVTLAKEISRFFPKRVRVVRIEDYKHCKDANELLCTEGQEAVKDAIKNAKPVVSFRIKSLSDVERVDLSNLKSYPTGFKAVDKAIGNGFHDGELIILTGKCGEGKSTFSSILVGRMIQNGLKCFCYSGELPDYVFKEWLNYQISGTRNIKQGKVEQINDWYRDKCYIYDNSSLIDEDEKLFDVMGQAVRDLGCKFILIDNLMTAMEDKQDSDLFRQQSNFVSRLTKFAKGFNVIILLVAHPRKGNLLDNDSISGSGDITNRANLVLRFQRKTKEKTSKSVKKDDGVYENRSVIYITKNRTTGTLRTEGNGIEVEYFPQSMRLAELGSTFEEFIQDKNGFVEVSEMAQETFDFDEIPF